MLHVGLSPPWPGHCPTCSKQPLISGRAYLSWGARQHPDFLQTGRPLVFSLKLPGILFSPLLGRKKLNIAARGFVTQDIVAAENGPDALGEEDVFNISTKLPFEINSSLFVNSWGTIYQGPSENKYHNTYKRFPYPVGYSSTKLFKGKEYCQTIEEGPLGPVFVVKEASLGAFESDSPQKVWKKLSRTRVHGMRHFGFESPEVVRVLQAMARQNIGVSQKDVSCDSHLTKLSEEEKANKMNRKPSKCEETYENVLFKMEAAVDHKNAITSGKDREVDYGVDNDDGGESDDDGLEIDDSDHDSFEILGIDEEQCDEAHAILNPHKNDVVDEDDDIVMSSNIGDDEGGPEGEDALPLDIYSDQGRRPAEDLPTTFSKIGSLQRNFRRSFKSGPHKFMFERAKRGTDNFAKREITADANRDDNHFANNAVYRSPYVTRQKPSLPTDKQVWRKGEGVTGHMPIPINKEQAGEQTRAGQWSGSRSLSSSMRPFEGSIPKRKEETSRNSQVLLELLQKWNKVKKWDHDSGDRSREKLRNMHSWQEDGIQAFHELNLGDGKLSCTPGSKSTCPPVNTTDSIPSAHTRPSFKSFRKESFPDRSANNVGTVFDELWSSKTVDESTNTAVNKLFEAEEKRLMPQDGDHRSPVTGWASPVDDSKSIKQGMRSWKSAEIGRDTNASCIPADSINGLKNLVQVELKLEKSNSRFEAPKEQVINDSLNLPGKFVELPRMVTLPWKYNTTSEIEKENVQHSLNAAGQDVELLQARNESSAVKLGHIEEVKKLIANNRLEDALEKIRGMVLSGMTVDEEVYEVVLGFKLDSWQIQVLKHVQDGNSVLVSAPGGAGKSAVADCCLYHSVVMEHRALFVTPSEHLADAKLGHFSSFFGKSNVDGMRTRTRSQKGPKVVVVTLKMLAKILQELNGPGGSEFRFFFEGVTMVVLDKFCTFNEAKYGNLWQEVLMLMDSKVKVLALSLPATNEAQVASWIAMNRGPCKLVSCVREPTPKRYLFCHDAGLSPLLDPKGLEVNKALCENKKFYDNIKSKESLESFPSYDIPGLRYLLSALEVNAMLPAMVILLGLKGCEDAMQHALLGDGLLSNMEIERMNALLAELSEREPDFTKHIDQEDLDGLRKGFAVYHEGRLLLWQKFITKLFQENVVKVLMVTESMLLQSDLMARTVILPVICKVSKNGVSSLAHGQLLQLIGRAGRRGYDVEGNVVFLESFHAGPKDLASLVLDKTFSLSSCFKPSYSMVVNLMAKHKLAEVKKILGRSFEDFQFVNEHFRGRKKEELDQKILNLLEAKAGLELKLFQGLSEVNKKKLSDAAVFTRVDVRISIHSAGQGGNILPGILLAVVPGQTEPFYMVFGADNNFRLLPSGALDHVYIHELPPLDVAYKQATGQSLQPPLIPPKENWTLEEVGSYGYAAHGNLQTKVFVELLMKYPAYPSMAKEGSQLRKEILSLDTQVSSLMERRKNLQTELAQMDMKSLKPLDAGAAEYESPIWKESLRLLKILEKVGALFIVDSQGAYVRLMPLGMLISRLHNVENELWLAMVITSKHVKHLMPAEFAGLLAALTPMEPQVESFFMDQQELAYRVTKPLKDAFTSLEGLRKQLAAFQGSYTPPLQFETGSSGLVYVWARAKPGMGGLNIVSPGDGDIAWKLRSTARLADSLYHACTQVSMDISEPNDFNRLCSLARRTEELLSRHLTAVDRL